jgi:hypothetical protein
MNELLELWNKHTFKITAVIVAPLLLAFFVSKVQAEDIEEVIVTAQEVKTVKTDPLSSSTVFSTIVSDKTWIAGGYGASTLYRERGAQSVHTTVYRNGIPANSPGSGWYDFGHDIASGETIRVISGTNGVMYGSGSIAGSVLIQDTIDKGIIAKYGSDQYQYLSVAPTDWLQVTDFGVTQHSVRNDNEETDKYKNQSAKIIADAGDFKIIVQAVDYAYDYDNCYTASFSQSNDCVQDGEKFSVSIRNEYFTIGRTEEEAEYFTEDVSTYQNENSRDYFRVGDTVDLSNLLQVTYGVDGSRDQYNVHEQDNYGAFLSINAKFALDYNFGFRVGNEDQNALRLGIAKDQFYINFGTSYRRPNLYEQFGDSYVDGNNSLMPEEGEGYEVGFGALSIFRYEFRESIEYTSGSMTTNIIEEAVYDDSGTLIFDEVTEDVYTNASYYNAGAYNTQGVRFNNTWGNFNLMLKYTDTDQARIPEISGVLTWKQTIKGIDYKVKYAGQFDRKPSLYDVLGTGQVFLDDLKKLNVYIGKKFDKFDLLFTIENLTNEEAEVLPFYNNEGREFKLAIKRTW